MNNQNNRYNWTRFWVDRKKDILLSEDGYFEDPERKYGHIYNPDALTFSSINHIQCLGLLGEPGIGKSFAIRDAYEALQNNSSVKCFFLDLRSYGDERRLVRDLFENNDFTAWVKCNYSFYLFLDSLDECRLQIKTVASLLIDELKKYPLERLFLRIACRTAEWPEILDSELKKLWKEQDFGVFQLAPLRRRDIEEAADKRGIESKTFLAEIKDKEAQSLAIKPVTLKFLLDLLKEEYGLPNSRIELYKKGCLQLCKENNLSRRDAGFSGEFNVEKRLIVASRIAALKIFSNRNAICIDDDLIGMNQEDLKIKEICGGFEAVEGKRFDIDEKAIKEALSTGLFISYGQQRLGWAHQTYAEFLAAHYLITHNLPLPQILGLITSCVGGKVRLIPQLYETSAWLAGMSQEVFQEIIKIDPVVLLKSDIATIGDEERERLTMMLLKKCESNELPKYDMIRFSYYKKLNHPGLGKQLYPYIKQEKVNESARITAIKIAHQCNVTSLSKILTDCVLDTNESIEIRDVAAFALADIGNDNSRKRLKPLIMNGLPEDTDDRLKGSILYAIWPDYISANQLFQVINEPKRSNHFGRYYFFLREKLTPNLQEKHFPAALMWVEKQGDHKFRKDELSIIKEVVEGIMFKGWEFFEQEKIAEIYSKLMVEYLQKCSQEESDRRFTLIKLILKSKTKKQKLLISMLPFVTIDNDPSQDHKFSVFSKILLKEDIPWILRTIDESRDEEEQKKLAIILKYKPMGEDDGNLLSELLIRSKSLKAVSEVWSDSFNAVIIDSPEGRRMKGIYRIREKICEETNTTPLLKLLPQEKILNHLDEIESGNFQAWIELSNAMVINAVRSWNSYGFYHDLTILPDWQNADIGIKECIVDAAQDFILKEAPMKKRESVEESNLSVSTACYRAFYLVKKENIEFISNLAQDVWKKWTSVILGESDYSNGDETNIHGELLKKAYENAPDEFISSVLELIEYENKCRKNVLFIGKIDHLIDDRLANALFKKLKKGNLTVDSSLVIIALLLQCKHPKVQEYAESLIKVPPPVSSVEREDALKIAAKLFYTANDCSWTKIWSAIKADSAFGRELVQKFVEEPDYIAEKIKGNLTEEEIGDFFYWLAKEFPYHEDPEMEAVSLRGMIKLFKNSILDWLVRKGTTKACEVLQKLSQKLPELEWLKTLLAEAKKIAHQRSWVPSNPKDILKLMESQENRLIQNGDQLLEAIIDSLNRLEKELHNEDSAIRDIWNENFVKNRKYFCPKEENYFSDYVSRFLKKDLGNRGIIVNREVQIHWREKTDIHVSAVVKSAQKTLNDIVTVIIEVKGCWHKELKNAMETQLVARYLRNNTCGHGLYLVGWFSCNEWDDEDERKKKTPKKTIEEMQDFLNEEAKRLSGKDFIVKAFVMDTTLT